MSLFVLIAAFGMQVALAEGPDGEASLGEPMPEPTPRAVPRGKRARVSRDQKETDGTQAPNRFEADTVIKSKYQLNGQPLEVDPD